MSYADIQPKTLCPRCEKRTIYNSALDAVSRTDNRTHICSPCGTDEGMENWVAGAPTAQSEWAVNK